MMELQAHYDSIIALLLQEIDDLNARVEKLECPGKHSYFANVYAKLDMASFREVRQKIADLFHF